eukprot:CAMPEP_0197079100 /NCGR_PEP_ID=MMETSP1384-20130603/213453_1 /TAXON_ID=29189 /ORGANISM="Ammonia sp." /LENGTH=392 /DNA_ID=CAMNT_0042517973 /DNA_START=668 /DNA_END=1846 /DNA_ORIENTATION=-
MYRVSYAPKQSVLAIKLHESVVITLSGGIVGAGFCNLVSDEESKAEEPCHALLHILEEDIDDIKLQFFVKQHCVADINVFMETDGKRIKFAQYSNDADHAATTQHGGTKSLDHTASMHHGRGQQISPTPPFPQSVSPDTDPEPLQNNGIQQPSQYEPQMVYANQPNQQYAIGMASNIHHVASPTFHQCQYEQGNSVPTQHSATSHHSHAVQTNSNQYQQAQQSHALRVNGNNDGAFYAVSHSPSIDHYYQQQTTQHSNIQEQPNESRSTVSAAIRQSFPDEDVFQQCRPRSPPSPFPVHPSLPFNYNYGPHRDRDSPVVAFAATPQPFPGTDAFQQYRPRSPLPSFPVHPSLCFNYNYGPHRGHGSPTVIGYRYDPMASSERTIPSSHRTPY